MSAHGAPAKLVSHASGFPHPIAPGVIAVVAAALRKAWEMICADPTCHLAPSGPGNPEEDIYTDALCEILGYWLRDSAGSVEGFSRDIFENVGRGENLTNFNLTRINKQPDMVLRLAKAPLVQAQRYVGLFAETKVVTKGKAIRAYTDQGIKRFVRGDYAWAMQDGLMVAYQKNPKRSIGTLAKRLEDDKSLAATQQSAEYLVTTGLPVPLCAASVHSRSWKYQNSTDSPGDIRLWHLWSLDIP
jgi:hypothetical protein